MENNVITRKDFSYMYVLSENSYYQILSEMVSENDLRRYLNESDIDLSKDHDGSIIGVISDTTKNEGLILFVVVRNGKLPPDCSNLFFGFINVKKIIFDDIDTTDVTNINMMFNMCGSLKTIVIPELPSNLDIRNALVGCFSLEELIADGKEIDLYFYKK